ncbi:hypothetical protein AB0K00_54105 [Dactylosporangium sp. NPDC049525]|uniref:hypothetical protein n=1 Tax=Dactylosporangium sp. NPDC049525 TaxID=3154730 RepID=UPI003415BBDC
MLHKRLSARLAAAGFALAAVAALVLGAAGVAQAETLPNGTLVQLGQYSIPAVPPAPVPVPNGTPGGYALPTTPGALGNPTKVFLNDGLSLTHVLAVPDGSSQWGRLVRSETESGSSGQLWRFQLIGYIAMLTQNSYAIPTLPGAGPADLLQKMPVYKIINYHADGTHTCLDGYGGGTGPGTLVDSYGCDASEVNQLNQLWVVASTQKTYPMVDFFGRPTQVGHANAAWLSSTLQNSPYAVSANGYGYLGGDGATVIANVAAIQAAGGDTTKTPVIAPDGSAVWYFIQRQTSPATATWVLSDTAPIVFN